MSDPALQSHGNRLVYDASPDSPGSSVIIIEIIEDLSPAGGAALLPAPPLGYPARELPERVSFSLAENTISVVFAKPQGSLVRTVHRYNKNSCELYELASSGSKRVNNLSAVAAAADAATCLAALTQAESIAHNAAIVTGRSAISVLASRAEESANVELTMDVFDVAAARLAEGRPLPDDEIVDDGTCLPRGPGPTLSLIDN
jgi:hypothetical protein